MALSHGDNGFEIFKPIAENVSVVQPPKMRSVT